MGEYLKTGAAGASLNMYHLARGCDENSVQCSSLWPGSSRVFWSNGYNLHGDDTSLLQGKPFCVEGAPCLNLNSTVADKVNSLQLIDFIFRGDHVKLEDVPGNSWSVEATVFEPKGA